MTEYDKLETRFYDLLRQEAMEDVCQDGSFLILKPQYGGPFSPRRPQDAAYDRLGRIAQYADLIMVERHVNTGPFPQNWSHTIYKNRFGNLFWDGMDQLGYPTYFHHVEVDNRYAERVYLDDRSLRALKVLMR